MSRPPANPTLKLLRSIGPKDPTEFRRLDASDDRAPRTTLGAEPRTPEATIAELERSLSSLTGASNAALKREVQGLLRDTEDGVADPDEIRAAIRRVELIRPIVSDAVASRAAVKTLGEVARFNSRDIQRTIGIAVPEFSAKLGERWRREHVRLIRSIGTRSKSRMAELLREASQKQTRVETLRKAIEEEFGVNSRRARLIARDQVLTLNAKLTADRQQKAGITKYKWRTLDSSSRQNHKDLNGKIFSWDNPPMGGGTGPDDPGHPGSGIGCRCQAIPVIEPEPDK